MRPKCFTVVVPAIAGVLCLAAAAFARDATVILQDGRQLTGQVIAETDASITLRISGIDTPIAKDQLRDIKYMATVEEEFRQRRATLKDDDLEGRYRLTQWLYEAWNRDQSDKTYELLSTELSGLGDQFPNDQRLAQLKTVVESRRRLMEEERARSAAAERSAASAQAQAQAQTPAVDTGPEQATGRAVMPSKMLDDRQINLIKVWEIDLDGRPNVTVPRNVRQEILDTFKNEEAVPKGRAAQRQFMAAPGYQVLDLLFAIRARSFYDKAIVNEDPPALRTFRTNVHQRYVLNYCGTVQCHGGPDAGSLFLFRAAPNSEQTVYTNFYILNASGGGRLIKRSNPKESLLLEYGLPRDAARFPHPEVQGWRPNFRGVDDPAYQAVLNWIGTLFESADYGIDYQVPTLPRRGAPTEPATSPAPGT